MCDRCYLVVIEAELLQHRVGLGEALHGQLLVSVRLRERELDAGVGHGRHRRAEEEREDGLFGLSGQAEFSFRARLHRRPMFVLTQSL